MDPKELRAALTAMAEVGDLRVAYQPGSGGGPGGEGATTERVTVHRDGHLRAVFYGLEKGLRTVVEAVGCDHADLKGGRTPFVMVSTRSGQLAARTR